MPEVVNGLGSVQETAFTDFSALLILTDSLKEGKCFCEIKYQEIQKPTVNLVLWKPASQVNNQMVGHWVYL